MDNLYANPFYYEIAFSYRDIPKEVEVMQELIRRYSLIPVKRVLELGCGNSPHMQELLRLGYCYVGIDLSPEMLQYSRQKAQQLGQAVELYRQDMNDFQLDKPVDFAFVMLGSLYAAATSELISHFASVSRALNPGGLYFLDWCVDFSWIADTTDSWTMERNGITVEVSYSSKLLNYIDQTFREKITLLVKEGGSTRRLQQDSIRRAIYPQEFLLISGQQGFEFIGWWNNWDLNAPLTGTEEQVVRPITVLRKRQPTEKQRSG